MKKWASLFGAFILGIMVASSNDTVAAKVQSLIGQKVTGELTVVVNGKELADKGAVINGKTNVPVRAITDALGGRLNLEGQKVTITTDLISIEDIYKEGLAVSTNKYIGLSEESLERLKTSIKNDFLLPSEKERKEIIADIELLKGDLVTPSLLKAKDRLVECDKAIEIYEAELAQIIEALQGFEK